MDIEFEKEMNHNKKTKKQVVEENNNNVKESRAKSWKILDKACKSKKSKESVNDDKEIFDCYNLYFSEEKIICYSKRYVPEGLMMGVLLQFIISISQFDQSVESEIFMCLFTLQSSLLKPQ